MYVEIQSPIDEETAAAIVVAVCLLLQANPTPDPPTAPRSLWASAGMRDNQRVFENSRPEDKQTRRQGDPETR